MDFKKFKKLIMIEQTFFALPFAYIGILIAGGGTIWHWIWASVALFGARTAGMSFNRLLDADIDGKNPRTENRLIPTGEVSRFQVWVVAIVASLLLVVSSFLLNQLVFYLSFVAVILLFVYSLFKRFSSSSHFFLGFVEAAAPIGGYLAVKGSFNLYAFLPGMAIMFWIAGIDIIYSVQDMDFDKENSLHSIPAKFGKNKSLLISVFSYLVAVLILIFIGIYIKATFAFWIGMVAVVFILLMQQIIIRKVGDYGANILKVFSLNKFISIFLFLGLLVDFFIKG